jgi:NTP pyrophosphatase (non-canonical NTP hydrolase)
MQNEALLILSEECAEVIQAISKCHRFGLDHYKPGKSLTNREHLEEELGDLLAMIQILRDTGVVQEDKLQEAKLAKFKKLRCWSSIDATVLAG